MANSPVFCLRTYDRDLVATVHGVSEPTRAEVWLSMQILIRGIQGLEEGGERKFIYFLVRWADKDKWVRCLPPDVTLFTVTNRKQHLRWEQLLFQMCVCVYVYFCICLQIVCKMLMAYLVEIGLNIYFQLSISICLHFKTVTILKRVTQTI